LNEARLRNRWLFGVWFFEAIRIACICPVVWSDETDFVRTSNQSPEYRISGRIIGLRSLNTATKTTPIPNGRITGLRTESGFFPNEKSNILDNNSSQAKSRIASPTIRVIGIRQRAKRDVIEGGPQTSPGEHELGDAGDASDSTGQVEELPRPSQTTKGAEFVLEQENPSKTKLEMNSSKREKTNAIQYTDDFASLKLPSLLASTPTQSISLQAAIQQSVVSRQIFRTLAADVTIEQFTPFDVDIAKQAQSREVARFDPNLSNNFNFTFVDQPDDSFFGPGLQQNNRRDEGEFNVRLNKTWMNGINSSVGYEPPLAYLFFPNANVSTTNPALASNLVTRVNIPLLRGAGQDVNLAGVHSANHQIAKSKYEVESSLQGQLRSIEQAYWLLHAKHVQLKAVNQAIDSSIKILNVSYERFKAERALFSDVARARVQLESLLQQRVSAERLVQQATLDLEQLIGTPSGSLSIVFVPIDAPEFRQANVDQAQATQRAISSNPLLNSRRQELSALQANLVAASNGRLPQLDLTALHRTSGLADDMGNSLQDMLSMEFNDFAVGFQVTQQLGARTAKANEKSVQLQIARQLAILGAIETQTSFDIQNAINRLNELYLNYESTLRQLSHSQQWAEVAKLRYEDPPLTTSDESLLVLLLDYQSAIQANVDAITQVAESVAAYNTQLAVIEEKQGLLLEKWGIQTHSPL
jgi:outer membrane protein TolC